MLIYLVTKAIKAVTFNPQVKTIHTQTPHSVHDSKVGVYLLAVVVCWSSTIRCMSLSGGRIPVKMGQ